MVAMSVSGLPAGATASFAPDHVVGTGSTTLTVATSSSTPAGSYQLTISGTSGTLTRTTTVTLVVSAGFSMSVTPSTSTVSRGNRTTYTVGVTAGDGFSGSIKLAVTGLPKSVTGKFSPSSLAGSGSSVLTISTNRNAAPGSYTLSVSGTSGSVMRTANVTLVIQ
jgi:hypothetical protein